MTPKEIAQEFIGLIPHPDTADNGWDEIRRGLETRIEDYARRRVDEAMKSAARDILQELPEDYWDITLNHLPKYHSRDEILWSQQMQKIVDDEMDDEDDLERYLSESGRETGSRAGVELSLRILDMALYLESRDERDRKESEKDTFFLQDALNDLSYRNSRNDKGMNLLCDWLRELKGKSGYSDNEFFIKQFKEVVGEEMWDQAGYERFLEQQK